MFTQYHILIAYKASKIIIVTLLKTDLNVPRRTLAESPASASVRRAVHSDGGGSAKRSPAGRGCVAGPW